MRTEREAGHGVKLVRQCEPARPGCKAGMEQRCGVTVDCVRSGRRRRPLFLLPLQGLSKDVPCLYRCDAASSAASGEIRGTQTHKISREITRYDQA